MNGKRFELHTQWPLPSRKLYRGRNGWPSCFRWKRGMRHNIQILTERVLSNQLTTSERTTYEKPHENAWHHQIPHGRYVTILHARSHLGEDLLQIQVIVASTVDVQSGIRTVQMWLYCPEDGTSVKRKRRECLSLALTMIVMHDALDRFPNTYPRRPHPKLPVVNLIMYLTGTLKCVMRNFYLI